MTIWPYMTATYNKKIKLKQDNIQHKVIIEYSLSFFPYCGSALCSQVVTGSHLGYCNVVVNVGSWLRATNVAWFEE